MQTLVVYSNQKQKHATGQDIKLYAAKEPESIGLNC